jgi:hypothetical protein
MEVATTSLGMEPRPAAAGTLQPEPLPPEKQPDVGPPGGGRSGY